MNFFKTEQKNNIRDRQSAIEIQGLREILFKYSQKIVQHDIELILDKPISTQPISQKIRQTD